MASQKRFKAIHFDLSINKLKAEFGADRYRSAYSLIQRFLTKRGFLHHQYSGYISKAAMSYGEIYNFENPILDSNAEYEGADKEVHLSAEKDCLPALKDAGFTFFGLANNHTMDFGASGLAYTLEALQDGGIAYIGCGENAEEAARFVITESGGAKIASIAVSDVVMPGFSPTNIAPGVLSTTGEDPLYLQTIREAKRAADIVIVIMHWGVEYTSQISENQQHLARQMIDAGADIIIGSHPHALQSAEIYNNGIVFYSLGNFVFDQGWNRTKDSCILRYCLSSSGQGVFEVVPVRIASAVPSETANAVFANRIFHTLTKELAETDYILENNRLYIYPPVIATT
jgi:poly-gamma-glutamate synthesis protein (capsule biosynthesis protein)